MPTRRRRGQKAVGRELNAVAGKSDIETYPSASSAEETQIAAGHITSPGTPYSQSTKPNTAILKSTPADMRPSRIPKSTLSESASRVQLGSKGDEAADPEHAFQEYPQTPSTGVPSISTVGFKFARSNPPLGPEAQRMMDEIREEASRIKARLAADREKEGYDQVQDIPEIVKGRKIALPKGKVGRFSDIHMAEFKKMDSIAGHPSAFRLQSGHSLVGRAGLKRTHAVADLRDGEGDNTAGLRNKPSFTSDPYGKPLENKQSLKRARYNDTEASSSARTISTPRRPTLGPITTPTQSSLARAAPLRTPDTRKQATPKSAMKPGLAAAREQRTGLPSSTPLSTGKLRPKGFASTSKIGRLKSILRHPSSTYKNQPTEKANFPASFAPVSTIDFNKPLPSIPQAGDSSKHQETSRKLNFTSGLVTIPTLSTISVPSASRTIIPRPKSIKSAETPVSRSTPRYGTTTEAHKIEYPSLSSHLLKLSSPGTREITASLDGSSSRSGALADTRPQVSVPGTFTFRSDHTIDFGQSPNGFGGSPGQASVRQVRSSLFPSMPGSFPEGDKENQALGAPVPRETQNRKRRRDASPTEVVETPQNSFKKHKVVHDSAYASNPAADVTKPRKLSKMTSDSKRKGLSLTRLNMLARPKLRR